MMNWHLPDSIVELQLKILSYHHELCTKILHFLPIFHQRSRQQKLGISFSDNWYDAYTKYYFSFNAAIQFLFHSLLSRALEYMNTTEVLHLHNTLIQI